MGRGGAGWGGVGRIHVRKTVRSSSLAHANRLDTTLQDLLLPPTWNARLKGKLREPKLWRYIWRGLWKRLTSGNLFDRLGQLCKKQR